MKKLIIIFSLIFNITAIADEQCNPGQENASPKKSADNFGEKMAIIASKVSNDQEVKVEAATTYLISISDSSTFSENEANNFINSTRPICENNNLDSKFRSRACITLSGLHGKLAQKLQMGGISDGKSSYQYLQKSLALDPENEDAITGHAAAIVSLSEQGYIMKKLAERSLNTNIKDEALKAKGNLERINKKDSPVYKQILKII